MNTIVVVGGGFAGLAALATLRERRSKAELILLDPGSNHIIRTRLHERIRHPDARCQVPFHAIERRFRCRHLALAPDVGSLSLAGIHARSELVCGDQRIGFDCLVIATGSRAPAVAVFGEALVPDDLATLDWEDCVRQKFCKHNEKIFWITVVGAGPSGIQILFELETWKREWRGQSGRAVGLRLVTADDVVLPAFPRGVREYVMEQMRKAGIKFHPQTRVLACRDGAVILRKGGASGERALPSAITFACLGLQPHPSKLRTNAFGQVLENGRALERIFAAGDCAHFEGDGANTLSAQVATRKGRLAAENIHRLSLDLPLRPYRYREQGYFISLGAADGAGWLGHRDNVVTGVPAFFIKEAVETLYDLSIL